MNSGGTTKNTKTRTNLKKNISVRLPESKLTNRSATEVIDVLVAKYEYNTYVTSESPLSLLLPLGGRRDDMYVLCVITSKLP